MRLWGSSSWGETQKTESTVSSMSVWLTAISPASGIRSAYRKGPIKNVAWLNGSHSSDRNESHEERVEYKGSNKEKQ